MRTSPAKNRFRRPINPLIAIALVAVVVIVVTYLFIRSGSRRAGPLTTDPRMYDVLAPPEEVIALVKRKNPNLKMKFSPGIEAAIKRRREKQQKGLTEPPPSASQPSGRPGSR